ncbi:outer membrane protein transport protein [Geomonas nitrogeniifigens]|uniref:OmpP1/FadL family transporter n=1 Tax=Geomonas diazotrophica TaxID=2843197 RepID=UPI001C2BD1EF|nr:outer membrane protein transport protein [Geomonas nitrogeniifigens]QXE88443.1 outer membrane protein transport protein [Geomonas nitrogeniifigens]
MNYRKGLIAGLLASAVSLGAGAPSAHAAGYAVFTHGASALGQGNAVTAHASDASTIFYNPALMNRLDGTQLLVGTTAIFSSREYASSIGGNPSSDDSLFFPSHLYVTHKFNDQVSAGVGIFNPFGLGTKWADNWDGRYIATRSDLKTFDINPVLSYRVLPSLSLAAGVDVVLLDATLQRKIPSAALTPLLGYAPGTDINQKFKGDGTGVGFNVAAAWDPCEHLTVGASYRSQVYVDVSGDAVFASPAPLAPPVTVLNSGGKTDLTLPPQFTAGVAFKGIDKLTLEAGVRWEGWSKFKNLNIRLDNGSSSLTPRNWKDNWGLNLGGRYQVDPRVALLAGYVYGDSAVPDSTFDPSIPDAKTHVFCVGTDVDLKPFTVAVAYGYQYYENRNKNNTIYGLPGIAATSANGKYQSDAHLVALSLGYKF